MTSRDRQIGFEQLGIGSVLTRNTLRVPPNQREYAWEERHVRSLFQDLSRAIGEGAPEYFLGTIVSIPQETGVLIIVDGQQRLATTAILLAAIRDYLKGREGDKIIVEDIDNRFLSAIDRAARERVSKLRLNTTDATYFERRIIYSEPGLGANAPLSHTLIDQAANLAKEHIQRVVSQLGDKDRGDQLNRWVNFIEHDALVILLRVPSDVNAYKMFETLNDRGLRTSQADMVKNYLFGESGDRLGEAQARWAAMKGMLDSVDDDDITITFLRQMLISLYGHLRDPDVYETVQSKARGVSSTLSFLGTLESGAADYVAMLNPDHEKWNRYPPQMRRAIQTLVRLRVRPIRPLTLAIIRSFNEKETAKALRLLVSVVVRFLIVGGARSGHVEEGLADAARRISEGSIKNTEELLAAISAKVPNDLEFKEQFRVAHVSNAALARYYLRSLESVNRADQFASFIPHDEPDVINLEHVLPIRPQGNWPTWSQDMMDAFYTRLGNLALLRATTNSDLKSAPFEAKRAAYGESTFELTRQIADEREWTPETINERQETMAGLALKAWPLSIVWP